MKKSKQMARSAWRAYYHGSGWDIRIERADTMIRWHRSAKP